MASRKSELVVTYVTKKMQGAQLGAPLPAQRAVRDETGISLAVVVEGYRLLCERGLAYKSRDGFFWGLAGIATPVPVRREDRVEAGDVLAMRECFLDPFAVFQAALLVQKGNGVLRERCKEEIALIDHELRTRSLAVHQEADWRFHHFFWFSGGDRVVSMVARGIESALRRSIRCNVVTLGSNFDVLVERAEDHKRILSFVILGEAEEGREAAIRHVRNVKHRLGSKGCKLLLT